MAIDVILFISIEPRSPKPIVSVISLILFGPIIVRIDDNKASIKATIIPFLKSLSLVNNFFIDSLKFFGFSAIGVFFLSSITVPPHLIAIKQSLYIHYNF